MFDDNNIDKMMKSILDNAQEEVPAHVWEGVSAGLDKAAKRKAVVIWWRRAAMGAAAAAVIIFGLMFTRGGGQTSQSSDPRNDNFIAVIDQPGSTDTTMTEEITPPENVLMAEAYIPKASHPAGYRPSSVVDAQETVDVAGMEEVPNVEEVRNVKEDRNEKEDDKKSAEAVTAISETYRPSEPTRFEEWEEEAPARKRRTSLVLSGITGTNSAQNMGRANLMKRPSLNSGPATTGVTETSTNTTYGIPVSVGAGVKFDLNERWALGVGVNYSYLSRKFYGTYTKADENGVEINSTASDIRNSQHFVGIPVNAYCNIVNNKHVNLYAYAGGTVEKCVSDKYEVLSTSIVHTEKPEGVQLSANIGLGVEFRLGQHLGLYVDPSLRYYFDNGQPKSIRTAQPLMLGFEMGLRVNL